MRVVVNSAILLYRLTNKHIFNSMKITLTEALKLQKLLMKELKTTQSYLISNNSIKETDIATLKSTLDTQNANRELMIELKKSIRENTPINIVEKVFKLSELKEDLKCYSRMSTKQGTFVEGDKEVTYIVQLSPEEILSITKDVKSEILSIEKELENFNSTTEIEINDNFIFEEKIIPKS